MIAALVIVGVTVLTRYGSMAVDTKPQIYLNPDMAVSSSLSAWQNVPALGQPSFEVGLLLPALTSWGLQSVGVSAWLAMRVLRLLLTAVGVAGMYRLMADLAEAVTGTRPSPWVPRVAAVVYVAHPYVLAGGSTLPVFWPWAVLPWFAWCLVRGVRSGDAVRWGVAAGLCFGAMTGQNAGSVALLQALVTAPVVLLVCATALQGAWWRAVRVGLVAGLTAALVSVYWVLPSLAARGAGAAVVGQSESGAAISATSSWSEVIRGLGLWVLYGSNGPDPWVPDLVGLVRAPVLVLAAFAVVATAWLALARAPRVLARLGLTLVAVAAVVMVGSHPWEAPTPVGRGWQWLLNTLPALGVLRTTNKAGAVLVLGCAVLCGALVLAVRRRRLATAAVTSLAVLSVLPWWTGHAYISTADVPAYWRDAVASTDSDGRGRVWLLPGQASAAYQWSDRRPDDVVQGLFTHREAIVRTAVANTSAEGASLLRGLDRRLQEGTMPPAALAATARYLAVTDLLVRDDVTLQTDGGATAQAVHIAVAGSTGLQPDGEFGTATDGSTVVHRYRVGDPVPGPTTAPAGSLVAVVGDGDAVPDLAQLGYLDGRTPFVFAASTTASPSLLAHASRFVLTDTNRRAATVPGRLSEDLGPTVTADTTLQTAALGEASDQTVLVPEGWTATATRAGSIFRSTPWADPENAVDGDPASAWYAGDYGSAAGQQLRVDLPTPLGGPVVVRTTGVADSRIVGMSLRADGQSAAMQPVGDGVFRAVLPGPTRSLVLAVDAVEGGGNVGVVDVTVDGRSSPAPDQLLLPRTLQRLVTEGASHGTPVAARPVDVVLTRTQGIQGAPGPTQTRLNRQFDLPWPQDVTVRGVFRLSQPMPEDALDAMDGADGTVRATSSSQAFNLPTVRASMALDGDPGTGWQPAEPAVGATWSMTLAEPRVTDSVTVTQPETGRQITTVAVAVNGGPAVTHELDPGETQIALGGPVGVRELSLTLVGVSSPASEPARLLEVDLAGARLDRPDQAAPGCAPFGTLDGEPVSMRPVGPVTSTAVLAVGCGGSLPLAAGRHTWAGVPAWVGDTVVLAAPDPALPPVSLQPLPGDTDLPGQGADPSWSGYLPAQPQDVLLNSRVGYDPRWHLTVGGRDLGPAVNLDGYAAGWVVPAGTAGQVQVTYAPQRWLWAGLAVSGASVLLAAAILVLRRPRSRPLPHAARAPRRPARAGIALGLAAVAAFLVAGWAGVGGVGAAALVLLLGRAWGRPRWPTVAAATVVAWAAVALSWWAGAENALDPISTLVVSRTWWAAGLTAGLVVGSLVLVWWPQGGVRHGESSPALDPAA